MFRGFRPKHGAWALGLMAVLAADAAPRDADRGEPARAGRHVSAFERYRPYADQAVRPWREVNAEVGRIGGWRAYAREANEAAERPAPAQGEAPAGQHPHHH